MRVPGKYLVSIRKAQNKYHQHAGRGHRDWYLLTSLISRTRWGAWLYDCWTISDEASNIISKQYLILHLSPSFSFCVLTPNQNIYCTFFLFFLHHLTHLLTELVSGWSLNLISRCHQTLDRDPLTTIVGITWRPGPKVILTKTKCIQMFTKPSYTESIGFVTQI